MNRKQRGDGGGRARTRVHVHRVEVPTRVQVPVYDEYDVTGPRLVFGTGGRVIRMGKSRSATRTGGVGGGGGSSTHDLVSRFFAISGHRRAHARCPARAGSHEEARGFLRACPGLPSPRAFYFRVSTLFDHLRARATHFRFPRGG